MTKLKPGMYIAYDFNSAITGKEIRAVKLTEKDCVYPADRVRTQSFGSLENFMKNGMKGGRTYMEKRPARFFTNYPSLELPLNYWRIPPPEAQTFFAEQDAEIGHYYQKIRDIEAAKREYAKEHRLEWEMPTLVDLVAFAPKKEAVA